MLGRRQPRGQGWSTFGRSKFLLLLSDESGMFLVSNEKACSKLQFDSIFFLMAKNVLL